MKTRYDAQSDSFYVRFADAPVFESEEVRPGVVFDYDQEGRIVAVEILEASEHLTENADLRQSSAA
jgi:uncharacterized protein YuzE